MTTLPPPAEFLAIQQVVNSLWARTDRVIDAPAEELFADDGVMRIGTLSATGRAEIDRYNAERRATENVSRRRVRHFCTNMIVTDYAPDRSGCAVHCWYSRASVTCRSNRRFLPISPIS